MTRLDEVQHPYRPTIHEQLPDSSCKIVDKNDVLHYLGAENCSADSAGTLVDRVTEGRQKPSGCTIRKLVTPEDVTDGLTLPQVTKVIRVHYGIAITDYVGTGVCKPEFLARQLRAGRPALVQGNTEAYIPTKFKVTDNPVNHMEMWNEVRGGTLDHPAEVLVFDSCADHRRPDIDQGPTWIPWTTALRFVADLRPSGKGAKLGPGKVYCGIGPDTEPHVHLVKGGRRATPFPDRVRAHDPNDPTTAIHSRPGGASTVTRHVKNGTLLRLYQYQGKWGVNDDGTEWALLSNVTHEGGAT